MKEISDIFNIKIENESFFREALTHPSYSKEKGLHYNYQRLEFLGDSVLKLLISDILYKKYSDYQEGDMSRIRAFVISDAILFEICEKIGLSKYILLGAFEEKQGCRSLESVCACAFEAILGAFYLDGSLLPLCKFIEKTFMLYIEDVDKNFEKYNAKAILQEYIQAKSKTVPEYKLINTTGPDYNKTFKVEVLLNNEVVANGIGKTKKEAEQHAAYEACLILGVVKCQI